MGPLAPADRPAASEPGGHLVNKMLVAKETEKPHHRPWLQLSGSLLLERFRLSYSAPILLFITVKDKVQGGKWVVAKWERQTVKQNCRPYARPVWSSDADLNCPVKQRCPDSLLQLKHPELHYVALLFSPSKTGLSRVFITIQSVWYLASIELEETTSYNKLD